MILRDITQARSPRTTRIDFGSSVISPDALECPLITIIDVRRGSLYIRIGCAVAKSQSMKHELALESKSVDARTQ